MSAKPDGAHMLTIPLPSINYLTFSIYPVLTMDLLPQSASPSQIMSRAIVGNVNLTQPWAHLSTPDSDYGAPRTLVDVLPLALQPGNLFVAIGLERCVIHSPCACIDLERKQLHGSRQMASSVVTS